MSEPELTRDQMHEAANIWREINHSPFAIKALAIALALRDAGCPRPHSADGHEPWREAE